MPVLSAIVALPLVIDPQGNRGLKAMGRLTGMIPATAAVELFIAGIRRSFFK